MKKTAFCLLLLLSLLLTACSSASKTAWTAHPLSATDAQSMFPDSSGGTVAVAVTVNDSFGGIELRSTVQSEQAKVSVAVYRAEKDYATTLSSSPKREKTLTGVTDDFLWKFSTLPAGDYLIVLSGAADLAPDQSLLPSDEANGKILNYRNGEIVTDGTYALTLLLASNADADHNYFSTFAYPVPKE